MSRPQRTLADVYRDKPLTDAQVRRIVALLGLAQSRTAQHSKKAA
ncbi:hypothetical protein [Streptomyces cinereoruber]